MIVKLDDTETAALIDLLRAEIDGTRFPLAPRLRPLRSMLAKLAPGPTPAAVPTRRRSRQVNRAPRCTRSGGGKAYFGVTTEQTEWHGPMSEPAVFPEAIGAIVHTGFGWAGLETVAPVAGFVAGAVSRYLLRRESRSKEILRSELERAGATAEDFKDTEQLAAAALRYGRAARDQAADENLRILSMAMIGLARRSELWASDFLKFAEIIAPLSRDELILIGRLMAEDSAFHATPRPPNSAADLWTIVRDGLVGVFPTVEHVLAIAARAQRSGLITPITGIGGTFYDLSPMGRELRLVVDVELAVHADEGMSPNFSTET